MEGDTSREPEKPGFTVPITWFPSKGIIGLYIERVHQDKQAEDSKSKFPPVNLFIHKLGIPGHEFKDFPSVISFTFPEAPQSARTDLKMPTQAFLEQLIGTLEAYERDVLPTHKDPTPIKGYIDAIAEVAQNAGGDTTRVTINPYFRPGSYVIESLQTLPPTLGIQ